MKQAKMLFNEGVFNDVYIVTDDMIGGFAVVFEKKNGEEVALRTQRDDSPKVFKEVDSAINAVRSIGFNSVRINNIQGIYF